MKYHVAAKFLAVFLCAVSLLSAVGSALGILALTELDLYSKTVDQVMDEQIQEYGSIQAKQLARNYASRTLGGCSEDLLAQFSESRWIGKQLGSYGYAILDGEGNVLEEQEPDSAEGYQTYTFSVSGQYLYLVGLAEQPDQIQRETESYTPQDIGDGYVLYDIIPSEGIEVYGMDISTDDWGSNLSSLDPVGFLYHNRQGRAVFCSYRPYPMSEDRAFPVLSVTFLGQDETVLYQAYLEQGVGEVTHDEDGRMIFTADSAPAGMRTAVCSALFYDENGEVILQLARETGVGVFYCDDAGYGVFEADDVQLTDRNGAITISAVELHDGAGELVYSAASLDGHTVGSIFYRENDGYFQFTTANPVQDGLMAQAESEQLQETVPETASPEQAEQTPESAGEETAAETVPSSAFAPSEDTAVSREEDAPAVTESSEAAPEAAAVLAASEETVPDATAPVILDGENPDELEIDQVSYYDFDTGKNMIADYVYMSAPEYTVELSISPGTMWDASMYSVLRIVRAFSGALLPVLGISLLLFAILTVYLCCAAGRKPKTAEIRAGGLNRLPLDLYLAAAAAAGVGIVAVGGDGTVYLLRQNVQTGCACAVAAAFCACLIFVGFCFAFVAQVKTPGGYWWRNTVCFRCLGLLVQFARWLVGFARRLVKFLSAKFFPWMFRLLNRVFGGIGSLIRRFYGLLPLTWQWLLSGGILLLLMLVSVNTYSGGLRMLCVLADMALILYGAYCFGILMKSAKRMGKGDLDTKVDDRILAGSFLEFAGDLNALADVAVVAAQKQLKSERMKTELITNVSHDLKTPLTSIINYVDLLQKPHTGEEQELYLEVLSRQSQRLKKLIDDLMEISKASTGNMTVEVTRVDAVEAVNQALGEFSDKLDKAQLTAVFRHREESLPMMADGRLVWRVMSNLLSNAVKYAMPGTRLYIDLTALDGKVMISLKNISRDELNVDADELMERFVRGDDSRNTEGSGLGLNIAKSLMELQKGQLQLLVDGDLFKVTLLFPGA